MPDINRVVTHRCCPVCGHIVNQLEIELASFAYPCVHGCEGVTIDDFQPMYLGEEHEDSC